MIRTVKILYITLLFSAFTPFVGSAQSVGVVGLEDNEKYIELRESATKLEHKEDSLSRQMVIVVGKVKTDADNKTKYSKHILQLEGELFDVRSKLGLISGEINSIEQELVIENLNRGISVTPDAAGSEGNSTIKNAATLTRNSIFSDNLTQSDYEILNRAQSREISIMKYIDIYSVNYNTIAGIRDVYMVEEDIVVADSLYDKYKSAYDLNRVICDTIATIWRGIHDNKGYYYNLILDKLNKTEDIEKFGAKLAVTAQNRASVVGKYDSDVISTYYLEKKMFLESEIAIAEMFGLDVARDSLVRAMQRLNSLNYKLEKIKIKERIFIDYDSIAIYKPSKYSRSNPISAYKVPVRGTVYKLLVGSYSVKQSPSIFRGAYPISFIRGADRRYRYYIGSLKTIDEAVSSVKFLKSKGFRNPTIVGWIDGVEYDVDMESEMGEEGRAYRIDINLSGDFPEDITELVKENSVNKDISRVNETYTIGLFDSKVSASRLTKKIKALIPDLDVVISEINL